MINFIIYRKKRNRENVTEFFLFVVVISRQNKREGKKLIDTRQAVGIERCKNFLVLSY